MARRGGGVSPAIENVRRRKELSGWHRQQEAIRVGDFSASAAGVMPAGPTAWDRLLYSLGLADGDVLELLRAGREAKQACKARRKAAAIFAFVRANFATRYVPEDVLELLEFDPGDRSEFYRILDLERRAAL